jgi:RNA polymerase sigma-70 factor (ECF subfamily)
LNKLSKAKELIQNNPDQELIEGCLQQDRRCQKRLFDKYFNEMMTVCMRYARDEDDAQEIAQKAFVKVFTKIHLYSGEGTLKSWIHSIMVRTALDNYRRIKREQKLYSQEILQWNEAEDAAIEAELSAEDILLAIQQLPQLQRTIFNLFALEGYSHKEIAAELGMSEGSSKWHLCEARKALKRSLGHLYPTAAKEHAA